MLPIKRLAQVTLGKMIQPAPRSVDDIEAPYVRAAHVQPYGRLVELPEQPMWFTKKELRSLELRRGDVVVVEGGAGYGRSATITEDLTGWGFQNSIIRLRAHGGLTHGKFVNYALQSALSRGEIDLVASTATIPHFTAEKVGRFEIPAPPTEEQRRIVDYLDQETAQIDALIAKQEQLIVNLSERRISVIEHCVWHGVTGGSPTAPTRLETASAAPAHWARIRNKDIFAERVETSSDGEGELLTVSHITGVTPRTMKNVNMFEAETLEGYKRVYPGDLAINTMWAWMGALGVSTYDGLVSPAYGVYSPTKRQPYVGRYYDYLYRTRSYVTEMTRNSRGIVSSRLRLYPEVFLRMPVVTPPIQEQTLIAAYLDEQTTKIDAMIAKTKEFIGLARERRDALITEAVRGRIDVSTGKVREGGVNGW